MKRRFFVNHSDIHARSTITTLFAAFIVRAVAQIVLKLRNDSI
jgi:hypothetical protein